jgi:hypothetical protein
MDGDFLCSDSREQHGLPVSDCGSDACHNARVISLLVLAVTIVTRYPLQLDWTKTYAGRSAAFGSCRWVARVAPSSLGLLMLNRDLTQHRANGIPNPAALDLRGRVPADFLAANAVLTAVVPARPFFSGSRKTNSAAVRNSLRLDDS